MLDNKKILLFDFGCILVNLDKQRCIDALNKIGCGRIAYYVDECRQEDLFHKLEVGGDTRAFCDEARAKSSYTDDEGSYHPCTATDEEICWAWNELLTGVPVEKLRLIRHLHDDLGYRTAILSNTNWIHWDRSVKDFFTVEGLRVEDYFDDIFLSCDLGIVKPDGAIYEAVKEGLGVQGDDIFFIDDSQRNCAAAEEHGFHTFCDARGDEWMKMFRECAAVIGNFDGVHRGHQYVLGRLGEYAAKYDLHPLAVTFDRHPREILDKRIAPQYLTTVDEKMQLLKAAGAEYVEVLHFDEALAAMPAYDFMRDILRDRLGVRLLLLGYDNRFGRRNDTEGYDRYQEYGRELGIRVLLANPIDVEGTRVSSSQVRSLISKGDVEKAAEWLGRPYKVTGEVVRGHSIGRSMGFPTANLSSCSAEAGEGAGRIIPANGVYETVVHIDGAAYKGMTNIGVRPTFGNGQETTIETHVIGLDADLYGKQMTVLFVRRIRDERTFDSPDQLRAQLESDMKEIVG